MLVEQHVPQFRVCICSAVRRGDALARKPVKGRKPLVVLDCSLEEIDYFFVFAILRTIAGNVEGGETSGVFAEFVAPETGIILEPCDPVVVHVFE